jgi:hypothetical protein
LKSPRIANIESRRCCQNQRRKGIYAKSVVVEKSEQPSSYLVKSSSKTYRRNRKDLLNEPIERYDVEKVDYAGEEDQSKE